MIIYRVIDSPTIFNYAVIHPDGTVQHEPTLKRMRKVVGEESILEAITRADFDALVATITAGQQLYDVEIHFTLPAASPEDAEQWVRNALETVLEDGMPVRHDWWMHENPTREVPDGHDFA